MELESRVMQTVDRKIAQLTSYLLWWHKGVEVNQQQPFQLTSGDFTPIYINCRLLISHPGTRDILISFIHHLCRVKGIECDAVAGGETGGIPFGAWVADRLDRPFVYVRKKEKGHGGRLRMEGVASGKVLLVEDLITDGGSKIGFIEGIRESGCQVTDCIVLVDREQGGTEKLAQLGVELHTLVGIGPCLEVGKELGILTEGDIHEVRKYLSDAAAWHSERGLELSSRPAT